MGVQRAHPGPIELRVAVDRRLPSTNARFSTVADVALKSDVGPEATVATLPHGVHDRKGMFFKR